MFNDNRFVSFCLSRRGDTSVVVVVDRTRLSLVSLGGVKGTEKKVFDRISLSSTVTGYSRGKRLEGKVTVAAATTVHECNRSSLCFSRSNDLAFCMKTLLVFAFVPETFSYCHCIRLWQKNEFIFSLSLAFALLPFIVVHILFRCRCRLLLLLSIASAIITFSLLFFSLLVQPNAYTTATGNSLVASADDFSLLCRTVTKKEKEERKKFISNVFDDIQRASIVQRSARTSLEMVSKCNQKLRRKCPCCFKCPHAYCDF